MRLRFPAAIVPVLIFTVMISAIPPLGAQSPSAQSPPAQSPIERLAGQTFTLTANDEKCGDLVVAELALRLMKRVPKDPAPQDRQGGAAPLAVTVQCAGEAPRFEASVSIAEASGPVLYKASGRTGAGFKGTQANFIASVIQNIFVP
ncbi:MAG: hypothetical protein JWQ58_1095 [Reyranella sp.]|nr:hypothetical protein [Reyranella sp.]